MVNLKHHGSDMSTLSINEHHHQQQQQRHMNNNYNQQSQGENTVYLGDLDMEFGERHLKDFFSASHIPVAKIVKQPHSSFAHVTFYSSSIAKSLLDMSIVKVNGRVVRVMPFNQPANFDPEANLILKNLESYLNESDIIHKFKPYGHILSCKLARDENGTSKCYAYLQFESRESARSCIDRLNNTYWDERCDPDYKYRKYSEQLTALRKNTALSKAELQMQENQLFAELGGKVGKKIYVGVFKKKNEYSRIKSSKEGRPSNLYVKNFGTNFGDRDLFNLFKAYGSIKSAKVRRMRVGLVEKPLGCGFVDFEYPEEAEKARQALDNFQLYPGKCISVTYADCKSRRLRKKLEQTEDVEDEILDVEEESSDEPSMLMLVNSSESSTASASPSVSPVSTPALSYANEDLTDFNGKYEDGRNRNYSVGSELSTVSEAGSTSSCSANMAAESVGWPNMWSKLLNTCEWHEYKLFDSGYRFF